MGRFLAARVELSAACWLLVVTMLIRPAGAQTWNDPRSRSLVEGATQRRAEQLADTALRDYQATAHGYVAFLAQLGEGFRTPPKILKTDELENEVYWKAPNLSKQRIVGRRDTLLLPTDIAYHTDHLGIVQNNFPDIIRIGDGGDEVADVPHPLSPRGLAEYDFALVDSFAIGSGQQRIQVYELKVRPKDDRQPRVVGAVYIDPSSSQVVRMNLTFTRAAFLDPALEDLSLVLENRLVGGRFWLPSRQEIEIRRKGEWLDYPARGIIRGRWEIGQYKFNQELVPQVFAGPEIVTAPASVLARHTWPGALLDSLPADMRGVAEPDIARIQEEARAMVRARALASAKSATLSGRKVEDFARFNRVEGLSVGGGLRKQLGGGLSAAARARYGLDDRMVKGTLELARQNADGSAWRLYATRDLREAGDGPERSSVINSIAAQEFGSDYTDPYLVRAIGLRYELAPVAGFDVAFTAAYEKPLSVGVNARPVVGVFEPTSGVEEVRTTRFTLEADRAPTPWIWESELTLHGEIRLRSPLDAPNTVRQASDYRTLRGSISANFERPFGRQRLAVSARAAGARVAEEGAGYDSSDLVMLGGPVSAPGYDYHSLVSNVGGAVRVEWRTPAPFPGFSLGRYGRVPGRATLAPYAHVAAIGNPTLICVPPAAMNVGTISGSSRSTCDVPRRGLYPAFGAAYILPFDLLRIDVARGVGRTGRWTFGVDISREFWSIL